METCRGLPSDPDAEHTRYTEAAVNGVLIGCLYLPNGNPAVGSRFDTSCAGSIDWARPPRNSSRLVCPSCSPDHRRGLVGAAFFGIGRRRRGTKGPRISKAPLRSGRLSRCAIYTANPPKRIRAGLQLASVPGVHQRPTL